MKTGSRAAPPRGRLHDALRHLFISGRTTCLVGLVKLYVIHFASETAASGRQKGHYVSPKVHCRCPGESGVDELDTQWPNAGVKGVTECLKVNVLNIPFTSRLKSDSIAWTRESRHAVAFAVLPTQLPSSTSLNLTLSTSTNYTTSRSSPPLNIFASAQHCLPTNGRPSAQNVSPTKHQCRRHTGHSPWCSSACDSAS